MHIYIYIYMYVYIYIYILYTCILIFLKISGSKQKKQLFFWGRIFVWSVFLLRNADFLGFDAFLKANGSWQLILHRSQEQGPPEFKT